jgi:hypothetical protein
MRALVLLLRPVEVVLHPQVLLFLQQLLDHNELS